MLPRRSTRPVQALVLGALLAAAGGLSTKAQDYPNQPIKLVVPFVAGGGVDVIARIVAPSLGEALGKSIIIENKGGAGGMLGALTVAQAPADGYTILFGTGSTHGTNSSVYSKLTYDPVKDFVPIVLVSTSPLLLVTSPTFPAKTTQELIALARSQPGHLSFASYGTGSINHLSAELFNSMTGIQASHIPYRGAAPALTDLIAGRVHYTFDGITTSLGYIQSGTIRVLGVAGPTRSPVLPDQPTITEVGGSGIRHVGLVCLLCARRNTEADRRSDQPQDERGARPACDQGALHEDGRRGARRRSGSRQRNGATGNDKVVDHRARKEHSRRAVSNIAARGVEAPLFRENPRSGGPAPRLDRSR